MGPSLNHTFAPGLGPCAPLPPPRRPITAENAVFPHAEAALYPLEIENLTLSGKEGFFSVPRSKFACKSLPSHMSCTYTVSLCKSDSCI